LEGFVAFPLILTFSLGEKEQLLAGFIKFRVIELKPHSFRRRKVRDRLEACPTSTVKIV
jgi:hypothetical protein